MPAHVLVLDAAEGIGPWARDALAHAGLACALVKENLEALRSVDAQWPALVVVPLDEVERWAPVLGRLSDGPTTVPVLVILVVTVCEHAGRANQVTPRLTDLIRPPLSTTMSTASSPFFARPRQTPHLSRDNSEISV